MPRRAATSLIPTPLFQLLPSVAPEPKAKAAPKGKAKAKSRGRSSSPSRKGKGKSWNIWNKGANIEFHFPVVLREKRKQYLVGKYAGDTHLGIHVV